MKRLIIAAALCFGVLLYALPGSAALPEGRVAHYTFDDTNQDILGISEDMSLANTSYLNNTLFINGIYSGGGAFTAEAEIGDFYYNEFTVHLDFLPLEREVPYDSLITGGHTYRWFEFRYDENDLILRLNNGAFEHTFVGASPTRNVWHKIICSLDLGAKEVLTMLDGVFLETVDLPDDFVMNVIGSPGDLTQRRFTFANYGNGTTFFGYADNLIIFNVSLSETQIMDVNDAYAGSMIPNNGIWKSTDDVLSIYLQKYLAGSAVVIVTSGDEIHTVFLDSDYLDGIQVANDLYGNEYSLQMTFSSPTEGDIIVDLPSQAGISKSIELTFGDLP